MRTVPSDEKGRRRKASLLARVVAVDPYGARCPIAGCGRPAQTKAGRGLSGTHCRYHVQWKSRHGCFWKGTYSASDLKPYRKAAERYLRKHPADRWIVHAVQSLRGLIGRAPSAHIGDVRYRLKPREKALTALARMRNAGVPPERLLVIHLTVTACVREDPVGASGDEYRLVQIAKAAARQASGYHYGPDDRLAIYQGSRGLMLRHLGKMIDQCCEIVAAEHLGAILRFKNEAYGPRDMIPPWQRPYLEEIRRKGGTLPPGYAPPPQR